jgi:hypothetical protein
MSIPRRVNGTAEHFFKNGLVLPSSPNITKDELRIVLGIIESHCNESSRGYLNQLPEALPLIGSRVASNHASG